MGFGDGYKYEAGFGIQKQGKQGKQGKRVGPRYRELGLRARSKLETCMVKYPSFFLD